MGDAANLASPMFWVYLVFFQAIAEMEAGKDINQFAA